MSGAKPPSLRLEIASAYAVTAARIASWVVVSGVVFRLLGAEALGLLTLVRTTIGILSYTSLGIGPALVKRLSDANVDLTLTEDTARIYLAGQRLALRCAAVGFFLTCAYALLFDRLHGVNASLQPKSGDILWLVLTFGWGTVLRLISDAPSGLLQSRGKIALDNTILASAEALWGIATVAGLLYSPKLTIAGAAFIAVSFLLLVARLMAVQLDAPALATFRRTLTPDSATARHLLSLGLLIVLAQAADFLYAPTDCILINQLIGPESVAWYSPAIQIDAGLLLLVSGLAAVLYPRSALAHAAGNLRQVRRYYIVGTLQSLFLLLCAAIIVRNASYLLFDIWFGNEMTETQAILPLILIHTVLGGSSAVGRSILLAVGQARAFTTAALLAGLANVLLSYALVRYANLGLKGIVLGTIIVVVARCAIWMPWYVLRTLRKLEQAPAP